MRRFRLAMAAIGMLLGAMVAPAMAWDRGKASDFATLPAFTPSGGACPNGAATCTSDIEGITVGPDGTVYTASFGFNKDGPLTGAGEFFVISHSGHVTKHFPIPGSSPHLIGMVYQRSSKSVLVADLGMPVVWKVNPATGKSSMFMQVPLLPGNMQAGLNALAIDKAGNVYVSDSFQGAIWMTGPGGGTPVAWYAPSNPGQNTLLLPTAGSGELLVPPFGANGIEFNHAGTLLYVMNTAYHSIVEIPVNSDGSAGTATTLTTGINAPDGIAIDRRDDLWVVANQGDEIVVVNTAGKVIAKKGDFDGIKNNGSINGLLFPASDAFSPDEKTLYVTNLALNLKFAGVPEIAVDTAYTLKVKHYNIAKIEVNVSQCADGGQC